MSRTLARQELMVLSSSAFGGGGFGGTRQLDAVNCAPRFFAPPLVGGRDAGVTLGRSPVSVQHAVGVEMRKSFLKRCDGGARVWARVRVANTGFTRVFCDEFGMRHAEVARGDETHLLASRGSRARREVADQLWTSWCESPTAFSGFFKEATTLSARAHAGARLCQFRHFRPCLVARVR